MRIRQGALVLAMPIIAACHASPHSDVSASMANRTSYTCSDGRVINAAYPDHRSALLQFGGNAYRLQVAESASGARYIGEGWQWWTKGMHDGMLAPLAAGEGIASAASVDCHAP